MNTPSDAGSGSSADGPHAGEGAARKGDDPARDESSQDLPQPSTVDMNETLALPRKESAGTTTDFVTPELPSVTQMLNELEEDSDTQASLGDNEDPRRTVGLDERDPAAPSAPAQAPHSVDDASTSTLLSRGAESHTRNQERSEESLDAWEEGAFRLHRRGVTDFAGALRREYHPVSPAGLVFPSAPDDEDEVDSAAQALPPGVGPFNNKPWHGVTRHELVGRTGPDPCDYHVRHLELEPGGHTLHQRGDNVTTLIVERGAGYVRIHERWYLVQPGDVIYVGRQTPFQLACPHDASRPMGVFVIMDSRRSTIYPIHSF